MKDKTIPLDCLDTPSSIRWHSPLDSVPKSELSDLGENCVHELFQAQVERSPDAIAVVHEGQELSYAELNARANQLARFLRECGIGPDDRVAICVERSTELIIGLVAVLKAGGAYVPLDPSYPIERLAWMIEDCTPAMVLVHEPTRNLLTPTRSLRRILDLQADIKRWSQFSVTNLLTRDVGTKPENLSHLIYTSGSTGHPKGVASSHQGIVNRIRSQPNIAAISSTDIGCAKTSIGFVDSIAEILVPLSCGARLTIAPEETARTPQHLSHYIQRDSVTYLVTVPSLAKALVESVEDFGNVFETLRCWVLSGESLSMDLLNRLEEQLTKCRFTNLYGSSEISADAASFTSDRADLQRRSAPIGRPILNTQIYVLDEHMQPVPIGVTGIAHVGGAGLARGYLDNPAMSARVFIPNPFGERGSRMYVTGDLVRYLSDGNIEFVGRRDFQVNINGYRIELGEIETRLMEYDKIEQAIVVAHERSPGERQLVAYLVAEEVAEPAKIRGHLRRHVPGHMIPAAYVQMEKFPLTPSGKIDRTALPTPSRTAYDTRVYVAPEGEVEIALATIWEELFQISRVGRHDDFFELGGHSLMAVQLISRIRETLGVEVALRDIFAHESLSELSRIISNGA